VVHVVCVKYDVVDAERLQVLHVQAKGFSFVVLDD